MIIKKYRLFEQKLEIREEMSTLLDMAIDTEELELVEFFVSKGARSTDETMEKASHDDVIFKYLLNNKYKLELSENRLKDVNVQKVLIDNNRHKYVIDKIGYFNRELKDYEKYKESIDNFFKVDGPSLTALKWSKDDKGLFLYFLKEGGKFQELDDSILRLAEVQKALIDFGKDQFVSDMGFNSELRSDPDYKKWLDMDDDIGKFNL